MPDAPSQARIRHLLHYDAATGVFRWRERPRSDFASSRVWRTRNTKYAGKVAGSIDSYGYRQIKIDGRHQLAHRLAWLYVHGEWPDEIDHENHVRDDNRFDNLKKSNRVGNCRNRSRPANNSSGHVGVYPHRYNNAWTASIAIGGRLKHLGVFETIEDAVAARKAAQTEAGYHPNHGDAA